MPNSFQSHRLSQPIRAVAFDAVGTLIYPQPSVAEAYQSVISRHCGQTIDSELVHQTIRRALASRSSAESLRTNEEAEFEFWADLVRQLCPIESAGQTCFDDLFEHFSLGQNWRCFSDVESVLGQLAESGIQLAIASNFDSRLNRVCDELPQLSALSHRIISSLIGWRKPSTQFFEAVATQLDLPAAEILFVGDDVTNDVNGALAAGMQAALISRGSDSVEADDDYIVVKQLSQLIDMILCEDDNRPGG